MSFLAEQVDTLPSGYFVVVEADEPNVWWPALPDQKRAYAKYSRSMGGCPLSPYYYTSSQGHKMIIHAPDNQFKSVITNLTVGGKSREIRSFHLPNHDGAKHNPKHHQVADS